MKWGVLNQKRPSQYPLSPDPSLKESEIGLTKVIPREFETSLPRLPWGSHKALIITLNPKKEDLPSIFLERKEVSEILENAGFEVVQLNANEADNPSEFRSILASDHWDILHFIGHMDGAKNMVGISEHISAADFVASCCRSAPPRLVVLNACRSGDTTSKTEVGGISGPIAEQFCLRGVDAVVATRWDIRDDVCLEFSKAFWETLVAVIGKIDKEKETILDVESALLSARKILKKEYKMMDACWLAYMLFTSRKDGCYIPSCNVVALPIEQSHPPFIELKNHVEVCEYLAPGGAGLYLMAHPSCTGKTTTAKLALTSLGIDPESNCFLSLRHDDSLTIIEQLHQAIIDLDDAPFHPLILDDAELLMNHIGTNIHAMLLEISKRLPLLLIMRESKEYFELNMVPFQILGFDQDELRALRPHRPSPEGFRRYLAQHSIEITLENSRILLNRMEGKLFSLPLFFKSVSQKKLDYNLLEYPRDAPLQNRLGSLSSDELLAVQMISETMNPIIGAFRAEVAWTALLQSNLVSSPVTIFKTLALLGITQEYHSPEQMPNANQIDEIFLDKIPEQIRKNFVVSAEYESHIEARLNETPEHLNIPTYVVFLYSGYTINHNVLQEIKQMEPHGNLVRAQELCISVFHTLNMDSIPRLKDVYDTEEMWLKIMSERPTNEQLKFDEKRLITAFQFGAKQLNDTLDKEMELWFEQPSSLSSAIRECDPILFEHMSARLPSLRPETMFKFGQFFLENKALLKPNSLAGDYFFWNLVETGKSDIPNSWIGAIALFWNKEEWRILQTRVENKLSELPFLGAKLKIRRLNLRSSYLLRSKNHSEREEDLLVASLKALDLSTNEAYEMYLLHLNFSQVLYRHLLLKGSRPVLHAFEEHLGASERLIEQNTEKDVLLRDLIKKGIPQRVWMHSTHALLKHRIALREQGNATQELRWIRDLFEAGHQIGQINTDLRRACISEAASRLISLKRRPNLSWSQNLTEIRAALTRKIRARVWEDRMSSDTLHVNAELHTHFIYSFDPYNPLPPILKREQSPPDFSKETKVNWYKKMDEIVEKFENLPDEPTDFSWLLHHKSASILEIDKTLGPLTSDASSQVAAILWKGTQHLGTGAANTGAFASTYPEHLTDQERIEADKHRFG